MKFELFSHTLAKELSEIMNYQKQKITIGYQISAPAILSLMLVCILGFSARDCAAHADPANCELGNGGKGNQTITALNFVENSARVGDTVHLRVVVGMVAGACNATGINASIAISAISASAATPTLLTIPTELNPTNTLFLSNASSTPGEGGDLIECGADSRCIKPASKPDSRNYELVITADMVGKGAQCPDRTFVMGVKKRVRALLCIESSTVHTAGGDELFSNNTAGIEIDSSPPQRPSSGKAPVLAPQ